MSNRLSKLSSARAALAGAAVVAAIGVAACGSSSSSTSSDTPASTGGSASNSGTDLKLVGYSPPQEVYDDSLEPGFQKTPAGSGVSFSDSFGASGDQSRAVEAGPAGPLRPFSPPPPPQRPGDRR